MAPVTLSSLAGLSKIDLNNALKALSKQDFTSLFDSVDMRTIFKKLDVDQKIDLLKNLDDADKVKILNKLDPADKAALLNRVDLSNADALTRGDTLSKADKLAVVGSVAALGAFIYLDEKAASESKKVRQCIGTCLPSNWDEYAYGSLEKDKLTYRTVDSLQAEFPDEKIAPSQPFCTETIDACDAFCSDTCKKLHETALPGGSLINRVTDDAIDIVNKVNPFKLLFGDMGGYAWLPLVIVFVLFFFFLFVF